MQTKKQLKPKTVKSKNGKKIIDEQIMARFQDQSNQAQPASGRRRLKKLYEVNQSEQILSDHEQFQQDIEPLIEEEPQYNQFKIKDDEDLRKQKEQQQQAKKNKKLKGNQQLDKFIHKKTQNQDQKINDQQINKSQKLKTTKNQLTPEQLQRIKKQNKKKRKSSDDFLASDKEEISQYDEKIIQAKRLAAYQMYNGANEQQQVYQKAIHLSLTPITKQEEHHLQPKQQHKDIKNQHKNTENTKNWNNLFKQNPKNVATNKQNQTIKPNALKPMRGLNITFIGQFNQYNKDELINVIQRLGATCSSKLTKNCDLVIQGSYLTDNFKRRINQSINQTPISQQAQSRNIRIVQQYQIDMFFIEKTANKLQHYLRKKQIKQSSVVQTLQQQKIISEKQIFQGIEDKIQVRNKKELFRQPPRQKQQKMEIEQPKPKLLPIKIDDYSMWTQKYKPIKIDDVIGQNSQIKSLREWLQNWEDIQIRGNKRQVKQLKGWNAAGSINSKATLLSGDPGIGKTTTARLLAAQYNYKISEFNASDVRNKSGIDLLPSGSLSLNTSNNQTMLTKRLIIMDEVDGMSSGDRGGITAIINMIKNSRAPIICICNDRSSEKIRSLATHCLDIKFQKPQKNLIVARLKQILSRQGGSGEDRALEQLVDTFQNDMRQILNYLEIIVKTVSKHITFDALKRKNQHAKDSSVMINRFDASRTLLNRSQFRRMNIEERVQSFFVDSDMVPLMVHQNILLSAKKTKFMQSQFHSFVQGIHGMVIGDLLDQTIRKQQDWSLMPSVGFMSCVYSTEKISESNGFIQFPSWLGKNSSQRKIKRLARQLKDHITPITLCAKWKAVKNDYAALILLQLAQMLKKQQVQSACDFLQNYNISPIVLNENLISLQYNQQKNNLLSMVPPQVKAKLTRLFNKRHQDLKLKAVKNVKAKSEHIKFNPLLEEVQNYFSGQDQQVSEQPQNLKQLKTKPKKIKNKNK